MTTIISDDELFAYAKRVVVLLLLEAGLRGGDVA